MTDLMLSMCSGACFNPQVKEGEFGQVFYKSYLLGFKDAFQEDLVPTLLHLFMGLLGLRGLCPHCPPALPSPWAFLGRLQESLLHFPRGLVLPKPVTAIQHSPVGLLRVCLPLRGGRDVQLHYTRLLCAHQTSSFEPGP